MTADELRADGWVPFHEDAEPVCFPQDRALHYPNPRYYAELLAPYATCIDENGCLWVRKHDAS